jgi:hypothetical protein
MTTNPTFTDLVSALDAAIYGYGVVVGQSRGAQRRKAQEILAGHIRDRDRWSARAGSDVPDAEIAYALPFPVQNQSQARRLAASLEERLIGWFADVASEVSGDQRADAVVSARACAVRAVEWGALSQAFPGENIPAESQNQ